MTHFSGDCRAYFTKFLSIGLTWCSKKDYASGIVFNGTVSWVALGIDQGLLDQQAPHAMTK